MAVQAPRGGRFRLQLLFLTLFVVVGLFAPVPGDDTFCNAWDKLARVEGHGTVGQFAPALNAFVYALPTDAPSQARVGGKAIADSWNALYTTYVRNGGSATVRLQEDGVVPGAIGGITAEWRDSVDKQAGRSLYDYAARKCGPQAV
ncbi:MAG: hypothetical protein ACJ72E_07205 [Marmoricola sp.]